MPSATRDQLASFLRELKLQQHMLIDEAAHLGGTPARSDVREIADLENAIAAVIALLEERAGP